MNSKCCNAWQHNVLAHTEIDIAGKDGGAAAFIDVPINALL